MQTPKPRNGSSDVPRRTSMVNPKSSRVSKASGSESDSTSSTHTPTRTSTGRSPKAIERRSPRSPASESKRPGKVNELESQLAQLQEDLKKTKDQLSSSEACKRRAQQEAEEAKKQLATMTVKLQDSQHQLVEFSEVEEARLQELRKISQERDRAWQSELEAVNKQHSMDSTALSSAMNEMHRLKMQLEMVVKSEAAQAKQYDIAQSELQSLKQEMAESYSLVETLKAQLRDSEKAENEAQEAAEETRRKLEEANNAIDSLRSEGLKLVESHNVKQSELDESRAHANLLEETVQKLQEEKIAAGNATDKSSPDLELEELKEALKAAEIKYQEEHIQNTMQIQSVNELVKCVRNDSELREAELESSLKKAKAEIFDLKANLIDKEKELQCILDMNKKLNTELEQVKATQTAPILDSKLMQLNTEVAELKAGLMDKETELQNILEENELLKSEMGKREGETRKNYEQAIAELELARASEKDVVMRLGIVTEEADKSSRTASRVSEQLEAAQAVNAEMEAELRRIRVQSDQWRKAAEAAAAVLTTGSNGRFMERTASLDTDYNSLAGKLMSSPLSDDLDDESPKKRNANVLRRIGGLWKKNPK